MADEEMSWGAPPPRVLKNYIILLSSLAHNDNISCTMMYARI